MLSESIHQQPTPACRVVPAQKPLLVHHVARMCNISRRAVRWAAQRGFLRGFKDPITPKIWRFRHSDVLDFIARRSARWT
jgi:hypothetical protein